MANTENIEARLCAYIDGELDAAGRAEIEAHLDANPQHRQLIRDLIDQRSLLRELPRASAPEDLLESVQTTLERSVLLDGEGDGGREAHVAGRINPWPRLFGIAAVLVLGMGLAAVIFLMLPKQTGDTFVITTPSTTAPAMGIQDEPDSATLTDRSDASAETGVFASTRDADAAVARREGPAAAPPAPDGLPPDRLGTEAHLDSAIASKMPDHMPGTLSPAGSLGPAQDREVDIFSKGGVAERKMAEKVGVPAYSNIFQNAASGAVALNSDVVEEKLRQTATLADNSMLVVVSADDPSQANRRVQSYLSSNNIRWEQVTEPMPPPLPLQESQVMTPARMQQYEVRMKQAPASPEVPTAGAAVGQASVDQELQQTTRAAQQQALQSAPMSDAAAAKDERAESGTTSVQQGIPAQPGVVAGSLAKASGEDAARQFPAGQSTTAEVPPVTSGSVQAPAVTLTPEPGSSQATLPHTTRSNQVERLERPAFANGRDGVGQQAATTAPAGSVGDIPAVEQQFIIARGLTPKQFDELNASISQESRGRVSAYWRAGGGHYTPTTLPSFTSANDAGQSPAAVANTPSTTQPVVPDQSSGLGASPESSPVTAQSAVAASQPAATAPVVTDKEFGQVRTTAPTTAPSTAPTDAVGGASGSSPATQPAGGDRLDVVIVLQADAVEPSPPMQTAAPGAVLEPAVNEAVDQSTTAPTSAPTAPPVPIADPSTAQPTTAPAAE